MFKKKIFFIVIVAIFFVSLIWIITFPLNRLLNDFLLHSDFSPKVFYITGNSIIPKEDILNETHKVMKSINSSQKAHREWNILHISPWKIHRALKEKFIWIKNLTVIRQIPDTFTIIINEYVPFAIWNNKLVLDIDGNRINDKHFISKTGNNIMQVNCDSSDTFLSFISSIKENNELVNNIKSLDYINGRRWNMTLKTGLVIKLPESNPEYALLKLIKSDKNLISRKDTKIIDVRIKNKTFVTK